MNSAEVSVDVMDILLEGDLPSVGEDDDFDNLFLGAVTVVFASATSASAASVNTSVLESGFDSIGTSPPLEVSEFTRPAVLAEQLAHPATAKIITVLSTGLQGLNADEITSALVKDLPNFFLSPYDGLLLRRSPRRGDPDLIVLPPRFHQLVCHLFHARHAHFGRDRVKQLVCSRFYWSSDTGMRQDVDRYISMCGPCAHSKVPHHGAGKGEVIEDGEYPFDVLVGDEYEVGLTDIDGNDRTISFADTFSKHISCRATAGKPSSKTICKILIDCVIRHYGVPRRIRSDHASVFVSEATEALYNEFGIRIVPSDSYMHRTIGLVERWHQTLKHLILCHRAAAEGAEEPQPFVWTNVLPFLELAFNTTVSAATGYSPFFVIHGRHPVLPGDVLLEPPTRDVKLPEWVQTILHERGLVWDAVSQKLKLNALNRIKAFDLKRDVILHFVPGDRVLVIKGTVIDKNHPKAELPTLGPFVVDSVLPRNRYLLKNLHSRRLHNVFHIDRLLPYPSRFNANPYKLEDRWPVFSVVGHRVWSAPDRDTGRKKGEAGLQYRIRWLGFGPNGDSWRYVEYLNDIMPLINKYNAEHGIDMSCPDVALTPSRIEPTPIPSTEARSRSHFRRRRFENTPLEHERGTGVDEPIHLNPAPPPDASAPNDSDVEMEPTTPVGVTFKTSDTVRVRNLGLWLHGVVTDVQVQDKGLQTVTVTDSTNTQHNFSTKDYLIEHTSGLVSSRTRSAHRASNKAVAASSRHSTSVHLKTAAQAVAQPHFSIAQATVSDEEATVLLCDNFYSSSTTLEHDDISRLILKRTLALHGHSAVLFSRTCHAVHRAFASQHVFWFSFGRVPPQACTPYRPLMRFALQTDDERPSLVGTLRLAECVRWTGSLPFPFISPLPYLPMSAIMRIHRGRRAVRRYAVAHPAHHRSSLLVSQNKDRFRFLQLLLYGLQSGGVEFRERHIVFLQLLSRYSAAQSQWQGRPVMSLAWCDLGRRQYDDRGADIERILVGTCPIKTLQLQRALQTRSPILVKDYWIRIILNQRDVEILMDFECDIRFDGGHTWSDRGTRRVQRVLRSGDLDLRDCSTEERYERLVHLRDIRIVGVCTSGEYMSPDESRELGGSATV